MKTKDAFALRGFAQTRIWERKFFTPRYFGVPKEFEDDDILEEFFEFDEEERLFGIKITDEQILDVYCGQAVKAQNECWYGRVKLMVDIFNIISLNVTSYMEKISRHFKRLEKYLKKWNEIVCLDESFSAEEIRTKTRRVQRLLSRYEDIQKNIKKLQSHIKRHVREIIDDYEKADRKVFAIRLRQARTAAGLTQTQLATQIGMSQGGYTMYENATREPSIATLKKLARILKRPTDWLLGLA